LVFWCHQDVTGESTDALKGSSQNTLRNKRLEHWSYRQESNFIDRERLSGETNSRSGNRVLPERWSGVFYTYIYLCVCVCVCICVYTYTYII
jgi:hypothetical protein